MWADEEAIITQIVPNSTEFEISYESELVNNIRVFYFSGHLYRNLYLFVNVEKTTKIFQIDYEEIYEYFDNNIINAISALLELFFQDLKEWVSLKNEKSDEVLEEWQEKYINNFSQFLKINETKK
jgi:hypothetical protein